VLKVKDVLWPTKSFSENDAVTKDWDLWGPLVFCLVLSLLMSFGASENQSQVVFTGIFTMVWLGEAICTLNLKLLGGTVYASLPPTSTDEEILMLRRSFFQSLCVLGYCLFPLTIAALINVFVHTIFVRLPVIAVTYVWSAFGMFPLFYSFLYCSFCVRVAWKST
jgi:protein YIPF6